MRKKALILSASTGGGHNRAARAIKEELEQKGFDVNIEDSLKIASKAIDIIIAKGYEKSSLYIPGTYGSLYKLSDTALLNFFKQDYKRNVITRYLSMKLHDLIKKEKPDIIIGTHPFPMIAISRLKYKNKISMPILSILTDYTTHLTWLQEEIDAYIVGDMCVASMLLENKIPEDRIYSYGIPIERSFLKEVDEDKVREKIGIENKFTVLFMGGSMGNGNIEDYIQDALNSDKDFQIIVVTGKNEHLKSKVEALISESDTLKTVKIFGFVNNVNELMSVSNLLVSKPGGLTTTEALLKEIPLVVPFYIPGQEEENLDFLLNNGLALKTTPKFTIKSIINTLIDNPDRLERIKHNIRLVKKENSAQNICTLIENLLKKQEQS